MMVKNVHCKKVVQNYLSNLLMKKRFSQNYYPVKHHISNCQKMDISQPCHCDHKVPSISICNCEVLNHKCWIKANLFSFLKVAPEEIILLSCKFYILLGLTFVEIKNSSTKIILFFNSKKFRIICYWKKTDESEPIWCFNALVLYFL